MESRPEMEGITLARELAAEGLKVQVITDAQAGLFASEVDAVLTGCDAITSDNCLQNKAGTSLLTFAANHFGTPCFAVTQTHKIVPDNFPHPLEEQEPEKVGKADNIRFRNIIFDSTPIQLFDAIYTENGTLTCEELNMIRKHLYQAKLVV